MPERRADIYTRITTEIVAAIENGAGEWRMPWNHDGSSIARPRNVASDKGYRGINVLALWVAARRSSYTTGIWGTYQQWSQFGCQVRKAEKATTVDSSRVAITSSTQAKSRAMLLPTFRAFPNPSASHERTPFSLH